MATGSRFLLQIVDRDTGTVVQMEPGLKVECDFLADCTARILAKGFHEIGTSHAALVDSAADLIVKRGVGFTKTEAHVAQDVRDGLREALVTAQMDQRITTFKQQAEQHIREGLHEALMALKGKVRP